MDRIPAKYTKSYLKESRFHDQFLPIKILCRKSCIRIERLEWKGSVAYFLPRLANNSLR